MDLHGFCEIDMLIFHEPARQASADGDQRDVEAAAQRRGVTRSQTLSYVLEVLAVARVAGEIPMAVRTHDGPAAPEGAIAIAQRAPGPVLRRRQQEFHRMRTRRARRARRARMQV